MYERHQNAKEQQITSKPKNAHRPKITLKKAKNNRKAKITLDKPHKKG